MRHAKLKGVVMGYVDDRYTRPLNNVNVFLRVHVTDHDGNERIYDPLDSADMTDIRDNYRDLYDAILHEGRSFSGKTVDAEGTFEFSRVPVGWWCYIITADAEGALTDITHRLAHNGFGTRGPIKGSDLQHSRDVKGIIVPVEDKWYKDSRPDAKSDDPPTDRSNIPVGEIMDPALVRFIKNNKDDWIKAFKKWIREESGK